jgi:hypothetical protein
LSGRIGKVWGAGMQLGVSHRKKRRASSKDPRFHARLRNRLMDPPAEGSSVSLHTRPKAVGQEVLCSKLVCPICPRMPGLARYRACRGQAGAGRFVTGQICQVRRVVFRQSSICISTPTYPINPVPFAPSITNCTDNAASSMPRRRLIMPIGVVPIAPSAVTATPA